MTGIQGNKVPRDPTGTQGDKKVPEETGIQGNRVPKDPTGTQGDKRFPRKQEYSYTQK